MDDKLQKVYKYVNEMEDKYYNLAMKSLDKGNMLSNQLMSAQATAFQRVRYFIDVMGEENE